MYRQSMTAYGAPLQASEAATPEPEGAQVIVRVSHCGVCHSDVHIQDGYFDLGGGKQLDIRDGRALPFTLGHEIAGEVAAVGPEAEDVSVGERYAVYPWIGCGECTRCKRGDEHLCKVTNHLGITVDGGYASHVVVPHPRYLLDLSGIAPALAGSYMCSGVTAYSAINKARPYLDGGPLMIVGLGGVGMMALKLALAITDATVIAADIDPAKRQAGLAAGAAHVFDPAESDARKAVFKATGAASAAIDFAGAAASMQFAQSIVDKAGAVVVVGLHGGSFSLPVPMFSLRQLAILGSFVGSLNEARELLDLARSGKLEAIPVEERPLDQANSALDDLRAGKVIGRVVLRP
jgi:D-arabinose 1-dehydrogenase-like Zn-dependent alcohol dehydrogenase